MCHMQGSHIAIWCYMQSQVTSNHVWPVMSNHILHSTALDTIATNMCYMSHIYLSHTFQIKVQYCDLKHKRWSETDDDKRWKWQQEKEIWKQIKMYKMKLIFIQITRSIKDILHLFWIWKFRDFGKNGLCSKCRLHLVSLSFKSDLKFPLSESQPLGLSCITMACKLKLLDNRTHSIYLTWLDLGDGCGLKGSIRTF